MPETIIAEKYRLVRVLGEGAAASVWEAENVLVGRHVAIKLLHKHVAESADHRARFLAEARAAARIAHPNVVDVFDLGSHEGSPFIVMELVVGETLDTIIDSRGAMGESYACDLMVQVLSALDAAHELGIVHRDLKPGNVMVFHPRPDKPTVKVLDFGIAQGLLAADDVPDETGLVFGTPEYISPEQATGGTVDGRTDLYAAGAMLYEMLHGDPPFTGQSPTSVLAKLLTQKPVPLGQLVPTLSPALAQVVMAALSKEPEDRPATARGMLASLSAFSSARQLPSMLPTRASENPIPLTRSTGKFPAYVPPAPRIPAAVTPPPPAPAPKAKQKAKLVLVAESMLPPPPDDAPKK